MSRRAILTVATAGAAAASVVVGVARGTTHAPIPKVGYVTDLAAAPSSHDLRGAALLGFRQAVKRFRVHARVVQFSPREGPGPTLTYLARQRYDLLLIGELSGQQAADQVVAVTKRFPRTKFVLTDWSLKKLPPNLQGSIWLVEQPAYLAGYLAGLMETRLPGRHMVGSVGGWANRGRAIPQIEPFIAGFEAGAKAASPGITTLRAYSNDFLNTERCRAVALGLITAGAHVLLNVAGQCGLGTLAAAKAKGVWGIGVDVDQSFLGPHILTSVVKRFDVQVYETMRALVRGRLRTGIDAVWDLDNGAVGLGKISSGVPPAFVRRIERLRERIAAGAIDVPSKLPT